MKYAFYFSILFSIVLMVLVARKWRKEGGKTGCVSYGFTFLIIFSLSVLFFPFVGIFIGYAYDILQNHHVKLQ